MPRVLVDIRPLRIYPDFRKVWSGYTASNVGTQMSIVAISYEVYKMTGSNLDVGLISLFQLFPQLVGAIVGGALSDAMDRRRLLLVTSVVMTVIAAGLALEVSRSHPSLVLIYVLAGLGALFQGANQPATAAFLISMIEKSDVVAASAIRQLSVQFATVIGPAIAGVLLSSFSVQLVLWLNAASFLFVIISIRAARPQAMITTNARFGWNSINEGFQFLRGRPAIQACFIADINAMVLGMPTALFPSLALHHFHGGPNTLGLLYSAPGIGALIGSATSGWNARIRRPGRAVVIAIVIWGIGITLFGLSHVLILAIAMLAIAGAADVVSAVFRSTILQLSTPDRLRGRLTSLQTAVVSSGPRLGNTEAGLVASATNATFSVVSGGIGCIIGILIIAKLRPALTQYEIPNTVETKRESNAASENG